MALMGRIAPQVWAGSVLALVACTPEALRLTAPLPVGAQSLLLVVESDEPGGPVQRTFASALDGDAAALPALPLGEGEPLLLTAHYYADTLDALGIRPGPLLTPATAQPLAQLPAPQRVYRTTSDEAIWDSVPPEAAPLLAATYTRARPAELPAHCARTRLVYAASVSESTEYPVAVHALPDGRGLLILRGGGTAGGQPIAPAVAVLADPIAQAYVTVTLPPSLAPRSFDADDNGIMWVGGQSSTLYRLDVAGQELSFRRVVTATMAPSIHYVAVYTLLGVSRLFAMAYEGQVYRLEVDRLVQVGQIAPRASTSDLGAMVALDEQHVAIGFATLPEVVVMGLEPEMKLGVGSSPSGYLSLTALDRRSVLAGGADATLSIVEAGRAPVVQPIPGAEGQWVRTLARVGEDFWWGGKVGRGGQYVRGRVPCPLVTLGGHDIRTIVPWGPSGLLVAMEGTGARGPSFAFHEIVDD